MTILVTGPHGHVGRCVLDQLLASGARVRVLRHRDDDPDIAVGSVESVAGDLDRPESLRGALSGIGKVFLYGSPRGIAGFIDQATEAGVGHVVSLSSASVSAANAAANPIARKHRAVESALTDSVLSTTFLRPAAFALNALQWAPSIRTEGVVRIAYPDAYSVPIHEADIAAVAVAALTGPGPENEHAVHSLTGPEALTQRQQVATIATVLGRPVRLVEQSPDEARAALIKTIPPEVVDTVLGYFAATDGTPGAIEDTVRRVTGHAARSFEQWVRDHFENFSGAPPGVHFGAHSS